MNASPKVWDGEQVRRWLVARLEAARLDQAAADRRGYEARDDFDKAAAEEWVARALATADCLGDQAGFADRIKALIARDEYRVAGINDDVRFERHVRTVLRKIARMTRENDGFTRMSHYQ